MPGMVHTYPIGIPIGGSGALVDALIRCLKLYGAELGDKTEVAKVVVESGRAVGVRLASGETIRARNGVIGQIHPWLLGTMVDGLDPGVAARARRSRPAPLRSCRCILRSRNRRNTAPATPPDA